MRRELALGREPNEAAAGVALADSEVAVVASTEANEAEVLEEEAAEAEELEAEEAQALAVEDCVEEAVATGSCCVNGSTFSARTAIVLPLVRHTVCLRVAASNEDHVPILSFNSGRALRLWRRRRAPTLKSCPTSPSDMIPGLYISEPVY